MHFMPELPFSVGGIATLEGTISPRCQGACRH